MTHPSIKVNDKEISSFNNALELLIKEAEQRFRFNGTIAERFEAFAWLHSAGIMSFRGAVTTIVRKLHISKTTIHHWMKKIESTNG
jgi:predicted transcriptional regulator YheO